jgi:cytochrome c oxidase assembly factor CtaG
MRGVQFQVVRVVVGLLAMFFAYGLARVSARLRRERQPMRKALTWLLRTILALGAILWTGGFDAVGILMVALSAVAFAGGILLELRPRHEEEIHLFPGQ